MTLSLIHTAEGHRNTFDLLRDSIAPGTDLNHLVRPDWLARAQQGIDSTLTDEINDAITTLDGPVLCSCTTLGPVAETAGAIRIDQPMMQVAAQSGGTILIAYCLKSTEAPSLSLLKREMDLAGNKNGIEPLFLGVHWRLFETSDNDGFVTAIVESVRATAANRSDLGAVVLAQASMAAAAGRLSDLNFPVLSSPEMAFRAALEQVRRV